MAGRRRQVWREQEDIDLVNCYLNVSTDPVTGTGQTGDSFWAKIRGHFLTINKDGEQRGLER